MGEDAAMDNGCFMATLLWLAGLHDSGIGTENTW